MSGGVFLTSDTHFGHRFVAELRGFDSTDKHDRELVKRWNAVVKPSDQVWHLGDVTLRSFAAVADVLSELNGTIHLITGNHDAVWPGHREAHKAQAQWLARFASIQPFARRRIGGQEVLLSHFPYADSGDHTDEERYRQYHRIAHHQGSNHEAPHPRRRVPTVRARSRTRPRDCRRSPHAHGPRRAGAVHLHPRQGLPGVSGLRPARLYAR